MSARMVVITGATAGIGLATARVLLARGASVLVVGRDPLRGTRVVDELRAVGDARFVRADLSVRAEVEQLAATLAAAPVDVLVNNVGAYARRRIETVDGLERTLAVNHLMPYLLTHRLLPVLRERAGRIVHVSAGMVRRAAIDWDDVHSSQRYRGFRAYGQAKLLALAGGVELGRRLGDSAPTINFADPGLADTPMARQVYPAPLAALLRRTGVMLPVDVAARPAAFLADAPDVASTSGRYVTPALQPVPPPVTDIDDLAPRALALTHRLLGLGPPA